MSLASCSHTFRPSLAAVAFVATTAMLLAGCSRPAAEPAAASTGPDPTTNRPIAVAQTSPQQTLQVPMQPFVLAYIKAARDGDYGVDANFRLPALWLYGPDGELQQQIASEQELKALQSLGANRKPQKQGVPFGLVADVLKDQFDVPLSTAPAGQPWTALLLLSNEGCESTCPLFVQELRRLQQAHPDKLHGITLTLNR